MDDLDLEGTGLDTDEQDQNQPDPRLRPRIAPPAIGTAMPVLKPRGIGAQPIGDAPTAAPGIAPSTSIARPNSAALLSPAIGKDKQEIARLESTGSGISQIRNPYGRAALRGLNTVGGIASAFIPQLGTVLRAIPGTEEHHNALLGKAQGRLGEDLKEESTELGQAKTEADTEEAQARAGLAEAQAKDTGKPKPTEEKWGEFAGFTDKDGTPLIREENSGQVVRASDRKPPSGFIPAKPPAAQKPDTPEQQFIDEHQRKNPNSTIAEAVAAYAKATGKPEKPGTADARADRSYQLQSSRLDKVRAPISALAQRMGRLQDTLAQGNPQADALVAPELLSVMAGGQGSGIRMNQAEIDRIVGGRSAWETLQANIQHWKTDPTAARSITPEQDKQIRALVDTVYEKMTAKQQILDQAEDALINTDDPKEHRRIVVEAEKQLDAIDRGRSGSGGGKETKSGNGTTNANDPLGIR